MKPITEIFEKSKELSKLKMPIDDVIIELSKSGFTITDSIIAVEMILKTGPSDAKNIVSSHNAWRSVAQASKVLVDELIVVMEEEGNLIELPNGTIKYREKLN